jgi:hypothetical protein
LALLGFFIHRLRIFLVRGWPQVASRKSRVNLSCCDHVVARNRESKSRTMSFRVLRSVVKQSIPIAIPIPIWMKP